MQNPASSEHSDPPVAFVSYSHTNDDHAAWVANLCRRLRGNGVDVHLDRWHVGPGRDLNLFMERYADLSARVIVVLSDDYAAKANQRADRRTGVGTETTIVTPTVYRDLGGNRVIPIVPASGTVADAPVAPTYLEGRVWIDFREDYEAAYEELLRELHGQPIEAAPNLGANPFLGTTPEQARAAVRNDAARWQDGRTSGLIEIPVSENSGRFTIGSGEGRFDMFLQYHYGDDPQPGARKGIRHYADHLGNIGLVRAAAEHPERFADLAGLAMSNRTEHTGPGDALVMLNRSGYWALLLLDDVAFRRGPNGYEVFAVIRFVIATDRSASLTLDDLPATPA